MKIGNLHVDFVVRLLESLPTSMCFWIENPDGSWFFRMPAIIKYMSEHEVWPFRIDYCRFGTPYRKRTRFISNIPMLHHAPILCDRTHAHTVLRGLHPSGYLWTKVAEPYPVPVADLLALSVCGACQWYRDLHPDLEVLAACACKTANLKRVRVCNAKAKCA